MKRETHSTEAAAKCWAKVSEKKSTSDHSEETKKF